MYGIYSGGTRVPTRVYTGHLPEFYHKNQTWYPGTQSIYPTVFGRVYTLEVHLCLPGYMLKGMTTTIRLGTRVLRVFSLLFVVGIYSGGTRLPTQVHTRRYDHNNQVGTRVIRVYILLCLVGCLL